MQNQGFNRRQFLQMAGVGSAAVMLAACVPAQPAAAPAMEGAAPAKEVVVLRVQGDPANETPLLEPFRQVHPGIDLEFIAVTGIDHEEIASKILSMIAAGEQIDFGYSATEALQLYAGQGLAYALDELIQRDEAEVSEYFADVHPSLIEAMMYEGSVYELPFDFNAANMYYNTQLFAEVAPRYDFITRALSFGRDRAWKRDLIAALPDTAAPVCLDLACGTGDLAQALARRYPGATVVGLDLTASMLDLAVQRQPGGPSER